MLRVYSALGADMFMIPLMGLRERRCEELALVLRGVGSHGETILSE